MPELEAVYTQDKSVRRRLAVTDRPLRLGRSPDRAEWATPPEDPHISAVHATIEWRDGRLHVRKESSAKNPTYRIAADGTAVPEDEFAIAPGERFAIGSTVFTLHPDAPPAAAEMTVLTPARVEQGYTTEQLDDVGFHDPARQLAALTDLLKTFRGALNERVLEERVLHTLLHGLPHADLAAVVERAADGGPVLLARQARGAGTHVSRRLTEMAFRYRRAEAYLNQTAPTLAGWEWGVCVPFRPKELNGRGLYVTGRVPPAAVADDPDGVMKSNLKFAELAAHIYGSAWHLTALQHRHQTLSRFLPRALMAVLGERPPADLGDLIQARLADVTVLFCDLRGFTRLSEDGREDLPTLLDEVSAALRVMTHNIVAEWGVIADFQGDAALGFWGWPPPPPAEQVRKAVLAALQIQAEFRELARRPGRPGIACGIGLAHGPGIAGRIGTDDQYKVGVFGPVVNLASRLEGLTKYFGVGILADAQVADQLNRLTAMGQWRCRRVATVRPVGIAQPLRVSELLPSAADADPVLAEDDRLTYEAALAAFADGHWAAALEQLDAMPEADGPTRCLRQFMAERGDRPPDDWDGVMVLTEKRPAPPPDGRSVVASR